MSVEHTVAQVNDVPEGSHIVVQVQGRELGIFNVHGKFYALPNVCIHQNGPLCRGKISGTLMSGQETDWKPTWVCEGEIVICPWHAIEYNITTGQCLAYPHRHLPVYPVRVKDGMLQVSL